MTERVLSDAAGASSLMKHWWTCRCCGKQFNTLPLDFGCLAPDNWIEIPEAERDTRGKLDSNVCIIDRKDIFVRGCLEIPIIGLDERFIWGVWVSVSKPSYDRIIELWSAEIIENEPAIFGWLCNALPIYPSTMALKTNAHLRGNGARPFIELEPTDHPLAIEQRQGITLDRVEELIAQLSTRH